jgi:uncharacterized membrane protein YuzA (DUF378 family)
MKSLHSIAWVLVIIGGLNWLLVGIKPEYNIVHVLLGSWPMLERIVYLLVGLSAVSEIFSHKELCKNCMPNSTM